MANMTVKIVRNGLPLTPIRPYTVRIATVKDDGYEWLEWPQGSGGLYYRRAHSNSSWIKWQ